jgi:hypothetical protein
MVNNVLAGAVRENLIRFSGLEGRMKPQLFHTDNIAYFDCSSLRHRAAEMVRGLSLIRRASEGGRDAAVALKIGFWRFVQEFELAIDQQTLPRQPLATKFGGSVVREIFGGIARAVRDMKQEEGSHATHWRRDAACLGLSDLGDQRIPGVQVLIDRAYSEDLPLFFAMLAGTEFVAEELSRVLVASREFTGLFSSKRWVWGEVHLADHDGPSHLEIDLDLARAYSPTTSATAIKRMVMETINLFGAAADDVEGALLQPA